MFRKLAMAAARRLNQVGMILNPDQLVGCTAMRPYSVTMSGSDGTQTILRTTFADIDAGLVTSEVKCRNFIVHYSNLPHDQRGSFLHELARDFGIEKDCVVYVATSIIAAKDKGDANLLAVSDKMRSALRPKYKSLFTHIGRVQGGVKVLVDLRADVLNLKQNCTNEHDAVLYQELNFALRELFMLWFTVGFLNLERITWNSPCDLVQKVSNYEAVHKIKTWEDIKRRVGSYRRCYIFTHNSMPREPVVVLHTALTNEISSSIHSIIQNARFRPSLSSSDTADSCSDWFALDAPSPSVAPPTPSTPNSISSTSLSSLSSTFPDEEREDHAQISCAVFYSITSTQKDAGESSSVPLLLPEEMSAISPYQQAGQHSPLDTLKDLVQTHKWYKNQALTHAVTGPLMRLCAHYLYVQKRRNYALNPVTNFHLSNGAVLWRINFLADTSHRGLTQSCCMMVNYRYFLESVDENSRNYLEHHQIQASQSVLELLQ